MKLRMANTLSKKIAKLGELSIRQKTNNYVRR